MSEALQEEREECKRKLNDRQVELKGLMQALGDAEGDRSRLEKEVRSKNAQEERRLSQIRDKRKKRH